MDTLYEWTKLKLPMSTTNHDLVKIKEKIYLIFSIINYYRRYLLVNGDEKTSFSPLSKVKPPDLTLGRVSLGSE